MTRMQLTGGGLVLALGLSGAGALAVGSAPGKQEQPPVPVVAPWPFDLERDLRGLEGSLRFTLRVERGAVVDVGVADGAQPELARAGLETLSTWRFPSTISTALTTTVRHTLDGATGCGGDLNQTIRAQLPASVEVVSRKYVSICDPIPDVKGHAPVSRLRGRVTCACATKAAIEGASLSVFADTHGEQKAIRTVLTDSDGQFRILGLSRGSYRLDITQDHFRQVRYYFNVDPSSTADPFDILLERNPVQRPTTQVMGGSIPSYPASARASDVQGQVDLRVSMEGDDVVDIDADSQSDVLARAAEANIRTWKFRSTTAPVLSIRFVYTIDPGDCHAAASPLVTMRLPDSVTVRAIGIPCTQTRRPVQQPLLVRPGGATGWRDAGGADPLTASRRSGATRR